VAAVVSVTFTIVSSKDILIWVVFDPMTIHAWAQHTNPWVSYILLLDHEVTLSKYNINNTRFIILEFFVVRK